MKRVAAITILYNFDENVLNNIKTYDEFVDEVVLVDNSDTDNYYKKYREKLNKYTYISMHGNKGIATATNNAISYLLERGYEWAIIFDQDSYVEMNIIDKYFGVMENLKDDKIIIYSPIYVFDRRKIKHVKEISELKYVMQSANLVNLKLVKKIGMLKDNFFIDMVDYEFCLRARKKGYKIVQCGNAKIKHSPGITRISPILKIKYGYCNKIRIYYQARNLLWTFKEYHNFSMLGILFYKFIKIVFFFDNKKEYLKYYFKGISDCQKNKFGVYKNDKE